MHTVTRLSLNHAYLTRLAELNGMSVPSDPEALSNHVVLNQLRFHYLTWGDPQNPAILFLHGGNQSARTWDLVCAALSEEFFCVALDQRGHGESEWSKSGAYGLDDHKADIEALVEHLCLDDFLLIGMSMGCLNALAFAATNADKLRGMVAIDAGPYITTAGGNEIIQFVAQNQYLDSYEAFVAAALKFNPSRKTEFLRESLKNTVIQLADGRWTWKADRRFAVSMQSMRDQLAILERQISSISCPVLVLRGALSRVLSQADAQRFADLLQNGRVKVIENAGHSVQGDNPASLLQEILAFAQSIRSSKSSTRVNSGTVDHGKTR